MRIDLYQSKYDKKIETFFQNCGVKNNSSWKSLGSHKRGNHQFFLIFDEDIIVGMSYAHDFSEYYPNSYRLFSRTAILPSYRGWNSPKKKGIAASGGCISHTSKLQWDWAKENGAEHIFCTTNSIGGISTSQRVGQYLHRVVDYDDSFEWFDKKEIYNCEQDVWKILKRDVVNSR